MFICLYGVFLINILNTIFRITSGFCLNNSDNFHHHYMSFVFVVGDNLCLIDYHACHTQTRSVNSVITVVTCCYMLYV